jgi:hypothetical protein
MEPDQEPEYVIATYEEIRLRFGLGGTDQARIKAKRRKWEAEPRNNPGAVARIRVPRKEWDAAPDDREGSRGAIPFGPDQSQAIRRLEDAVTTFREERDRLLSERDRALDRVAEAERRLEVERARAAVEAGELREQREEARIRAARAEAALEELRRPFWRRWFGA